ncbi:MAG: hypothetical protein RLZZ282_789 [Verrucomicrobiota bacterium]
MAAFLSYSVGCMMGRFSLDAPGLILANAGDTVEDYVRIVAEKRATNPNGIASSSPGLLGTSYPGSNAPPETNPNGVETISDAQRHSGSLVRSSCEIGVFPLRGFGRMPNPAARMATLPEEKLKKERPKFSDLTAPKRQSSGAARRTTRGTSIRSGFAGSPATGNWNNS